MPEEANFYEYGKPDESIVASLKKLSWDAFVATKGKGYTRVDIRQDATTGKLYVLELNAQCGISEDENFTSIGAILKASDRSFSTLVEEILIDAVNRGRKILLSFIEKNKQHN
jgi:D-alanine-D-alanine ligase